MFSDTLHSSHAWTVFERRGGIVSAAPARGGNAQAKPMHSQGKEGTSPDQEPPNDAVSTESSVRSKTPVQVCEFFGIFAGALSADESRRPH